LSSVGNMIAMFWQTTHSRASKAHAAATGKAPLQSVVRSAMWEQQDAPL